MKDAIVTEAGRLLLSEISAPGSRLTASVWLPFILRIEAEAAQRALDEVRAKVEALPDDPLATCPDCTAPDHGEPPRNRKCIDHAAVLDVLAALQDRGADREDVSK